MTYFQTQESSLFYKAHTLVVLLQAYVAEAVRNEYIYTII